MLGFKVNTSKYRVTRYASEGIATKIRIAGFVVGKLKLVVRQAGPQAKVLYPSLVAGTLGKPFRL